MSTRTIIEINHDHLNELAHEPDHMETLIRALRACDLTMLERNRVPGIRILGQRHHSETLKLEVK
jgi:hypothetical protein